MSSAGTDRHPLTAGDDISKCCGPRCHIQCTFDVLSIITVVFLMIGLLLITVGYGMPRNYKFDPHKPARVMEAIEMGYAQNRYALNMCIMFGLGFVTMSGLIISFIVTWELCTEENANDNPEDPKEIDKPPSYGSIYGAGERMADQTVAPSTEGAGVLGVSRTGS